MVAVRTGKRIPAGSLGNAIAQYIMSNARLHPRQFLVKFDGKGVGITRIPMLENHAP